jgi:hypothetical protein
LALNRQGTAIVFVSHAVQTMERLCRSGLLLKQGKPLFLGDIRECIRRYFDDLGQENVAHGVVPTAVGLGKVTISEVKVYQDEADSENSSIEFGRDFTIQFSYRFREAPSSNNQVRVTIKTFSGRDVQKFVLQAGSFHDGHVHQNLKFVSLEQTGTVKIKVVNPRLFPQAFIVDVAVAPMERNVHLGGLANAAIFNVGHPTSADHYLEYGNPTVTEFDYDVTHISDAAIKLARS